MLKKVIFCAVISWWGNSVWADAPVVDYSAPVSARRSFTRPESPPEATGSTANLSAEQRLTKLEQQINNIKQQNLLNQIDELQQRVQKLNGQVEDQAHQIEQLNNQLRNFYQDLNQRVEKSKVSTAHSTDNSTAQLELNRAAVGEVVAVPPLQATAKKAATVPAEHKKNFLKEQQLYQAAINLLPDKKYGASSNKLRDYLRTYPQGYYAANAHYWLGEINFLQKNYDAAEEEFKTVVVKYAKSKRVSDAKFKLALVHQQQGRETQAKTELRQIIKHYPHSSVAQLAKLQLEGNN